MNSLFGPQKSPFSAINPRPAGRSNGQVDEFGRHLTVGTSATGNPFAFAGQVSNMGNEQDMSNLQGYMQAHGIAGSAQDYFKSILDRQQTDGAPAPEQAPQPLPQQPMQRQKKRGMSVRVSS